MKIFIRSTVIYVIFVSIYFIIGYTGDDDIRRNYWVNYYWLSTSICFMVGFIGIRKLSILKEHKKVIFAMCFYWGLKAIFRIYLFFNIEQYKQLTRSAEKLTVSCVLIALFFIYLIPKIWHRKSLIG